MPASTKLLHIMLPLVLGLSLNSTAYAESPIEGTWVSEPTLSQLGLIQISYTFESDGNYSLKLDFQSFCGMGAIEPDCTYYWMVFEGHYSLSDNHLILQPEQATSVLQSEEALEPITHDMNGSQLGKEKYIFSITGDSMMLTDPTTHQTQTFSREADKSQ